MDELKGTINIPTKFDGIKNALLDFEYNVLVSEYLFCVRKYGSKRTLVTKTSRLKSSLSPISNHHGRRRHRNIEIFMVTLPVHGCHATV